MLPKQAIEEFKKIYKTKFNIELSDKEASYKANNLFSLYQAVYGKPIEKNKLQVQENY